MRYYIVFLLLIAPAIISWSSAFCNGWEEGYVDGYCYNIPHCIEPIPPLCPMPRLGESSYMDGYNRGFLKGIND